MTVHYVDLVDYVAIAAEVAGLDVSSVLKVANLNLADSALHAPEASFGGTDFYPDFIDKAAVLIVRLAKNHPLPDGNKRTAWVALRLFVAMNGRRWKPKPAVDDAEPAVLAVAVGAGVVRAIAGETHFFSPLGSASPRGSCRPGRRRRRRKPWHTTRR